MAGANPNMRRKSPPGPGRPKGGRNTRYVTIAEQLDALESVLGMPFAMLYAELIHSARQDYLSGVDRSSYVKLMQTTANKVTANVPAEVHVETTAKELSNEELDQAIKQYIPDYVEPVKKPRKSKLNGAAAVAANAS
jgi:hypothetical protein